MILLYTTSKWQRRTKGPKLVFTGKVVTCDLLANMKCHSVLLGNYLIDIVIKYTHISKYV